ncbi:(5-formylfuran-3-yl)methyl phosphate synthase [Xanthobacter aminoxidans]|uniref:(5-formylfuran-3-yl)methyl phosphate synthase n=1 Tax=Xanthobacter aminoxidans TaxID=186280 RepID=UPI002022BD54|nr:(5-formylfuran-3-yl)methyl phosphate synthase [Xanthobacter aminoxidans]MCL8381928.1 (5-formylfuran-3-yl)methyl phosphate synthase [Xanthobacter aminoxidans]
MTAHVPARPGLLASVATLDEMRTSLAAGVDILDLKNPSEGALGAWAPEALVDAVAVWRAAGAPGNLSATVGDHPLDPDVLRAAAERTSATGVPLVKIGFARGDGVALPPVLEALRPLARETRLIAVLFADQAPDLAAVPLFAAAGFHGVMLDTADKSAGGLLAHLPVETLARFVAAARAEGLLTGLAGSLKIADIAPLAALRPHYLGFRGALCAKGRTSALDPARLSAVRDTLAGRILA